MRDKVVEKWEQGVSGALRGVAVGAGYFSQFHYDAWPRVAGAELVAVCDRDRARAEAVARRFGVPQTCTTTWRRCSTSERPDFIDIITPADTHLR